MSVKYYNNPEYPRFLPIEEYIVDGKIGSFVYKIDNDLNVDGSNWANLATTNSIKSYIDERVQEINNQPFLYEDFAFTYSSILDISSGVKESNNYTNILFPNNDIVSVNTSEEIKLKQDSSTIIFEENSIYDIAGFYKREYAPDEELLKNESFMLPLTWTAFSDSPLYNFNISASSLIVEPNHEVSYQIDVDLDHKLTYKVTSDNTESLNTSIENQNGGKYLILNSNDDKSINVSSIVVSDTNIYESVRETKKSCLYNNKLNCYWDIFTLGDERYKDYCNLNMLYTNGLELNENDAWQIPFNLFTKVSTDDIINFSFPQNYWSVRFSLYISSDMNLVGGNTDFHIITIDNLELYVVKNNSSSCRLGINGTQTNIFIDYDNITTISLMNTYDSFEISINDEAVYIVDPIKLNDSKLYFGGVNDEKSFLGYLYVGSAIGSRYSSTINVTIGDSGDPSSYWTWNLITGKKDNIIKNFISDNGFMTNGLIQTPVFSPDTDDWEINLSFLIDTQNPDKSIDILQSKDKFTGVNVFYKNEVVKVILNVDNKNAQGIIEKDPLIDVIVPKSYSGLYKIKIKFDGEEYSVYSDMFGLTKIASAYSNSKIESSYLTFISTNSTKINMAETYIMINDNIWWNFNKLDKVKDYDYCNFEMTNNCSIESDGNNSVLTIPANNIAYINWNSSINNYVIIPFILNDITNLHYIFGSSSNEYGIRCFVEDNQIKYQTNSGSGWSLPNSIYNVFDNKQFIIRLDNQEDQYLLSLYDINYTLLAEPITIYIEDSYMSRLVLGNVDSLESESDVKFVINKIVVSGDTGYYFWNGINNNSYKMYKDCSLLIPEYRVLATDAPTYTSIILDNDISIDNINRVVYFVKDSLTLEQFSNLSTNDIQIIDNGNGDQNTVYVNLYRNSYFLNGSNVNSCAVGGVDNYQENSINNYIYSRNESLMSKRYAYIDYNPNRIYKGNLYRFSHQEDIIEGTLSYKFGDTSTSSYSKEMPFEEEYEYIQSNIKQNEGILVFGDRLNVSIDLSDIDLLVVSSLPDSKCQNNTWQLVDSYINKNSGLILNDNSSGNYYYPNLINNSFINFIGYNLSADNNIKVSANNTIFYDVDKNNHLDIVATSSYNRSVAGFKINGMNSSIYSMYSIYNLIKSGDFNEAGEWNISCESYSINTYGHLSINNSKFNISQNISNLNVGEQIVVRLTVDENDLFPIDNELIYVSVNSTSKEFSGTGVFEWIYTVDSSNVVLSINSGDEPTSCILSNISVYSLGKVRNKNFVDSTYWNEANGLEYNNGLTITSLSRAEQTVMLTPNVLYTFTMIVNSITSNLNVLINGNEYLSNITKPGIYTFNFTPSSENNIVSIGLKLLGQAEISYVNVNYTPFVSDIYFDDEQSWDLSSDKVSLIGDKLYIRDGDIQLIRSGRISPNKQYTLSWNDTLISGTYYLYVGNEDFNLDLVGSYNVIGDNNNSVSFISPNIEDCYLYIGTTNTCSVLLNNFILNVDNYVLPFKYNWQTINGIESIKSVNNTLIFDNASEDDVIYQYSDKFNDKVGQSFQIDVKGMTLSSGSGIIVSFGGNELPLIVVSGKYTGVMGSNGNYVSIRPAQDGTNGTIEDLSILIDAEQFDWYKPEDFNYNLNIGLKTLEYDMDLNYMKYYNNKLVGIKIGNAYSSGYFNYDLHTIENLEREQIYMVGNNQLSSIVFDDNKVELLKTNWIFVDMNKRFIVTDVLPYGKVKSDIKTDCKVWYNMTNKKYYKNNSDEIVFLIGRGYTDTSYIKSCTNIQKTRNILSHVKPIINSDSLIIQNKGEYNIPELFFNGNDRTFDIEGLVNGTYLINVYNTSEDNPYNLNINNLYVDSNNINVPAVWSSSMNEFINPYTLEEVVCEIYISDENVYYYSLVAEEDIIPANEPYYRLTYKDAMDNITVENEDGSSEIIPAYKLYGSVSDKKRIIKWYRK